MISAGVPDPLEPSAAGLSQAHHQRRGHSRSGSQTSGVAVKELGLNS